MKKLSIVAVALVLGAGIAYASSLAIPWFVDNAPTPTAYPPVGGTLGLIYLKNNLDTPVIADIVYVNQEGQVLGPFENNTFEIPALATVAFRPTMDDPVAAGGQESEVARLVPNRPRSEGGAPIPGTDPPLVDARKNGSATISWIGGDKDIQGMIVQVGGTGGALSYAHLLPPGKDY